MLVNEANEAKRLSENCTQYTKEIDLLYLMFLGNYKNIHGMQAELINFIKLVIYDLDLIILYLQLNKILIIENKL